MRSLIVEDDFTSRKLLQIYLSDFGPTHVAVNGLEAVNAVKESFEKNEKYDLICLDIMMPEMDGMEALKNIRDIEESYGLKGLDRVKIIMTTAKEQKEDIFGAFNSGCEAYIIKPVQERDLIEEIKKLGLMSKCPGIQ
jgi:two-component system chemotaxis response regulator CheY